MVVVLVHAAVVECGDNLLQHRHDAGPEVLEVDRPLDVDPERSDDDRSRRFPKHCGKVLPYTLLWCGVIVCVCERACMLMTVNKHTHMYTHKHSTAKRIRGDKPPQTPGKMCCRSQQT